LAYIGNIPAENYASFLTQTFSVTATASYTLDHAVSNENDIRLVINNVVQQPGSGKAYTASGTTLTLSEATQVGDVMYCVYLGRALQTVNPPNNSVGTSQLVDGSITEAKFASGVSTITVADQFRLTSSITANADPISSNLERIDTSGQGTLGTGMSVSSGRFTFPATGIYKVEADAYVSTASGDSVGLGIKVTTDNSSYTEISRSVDGNDSTHTASLHCSSLIDVTDTSNVKVSFIAFSVSSGSVIEGDSDKNTTYFTFTRLGDT